MDKDKIVLGSRVRANNFSMYRGLEGTVIDIKEGDSKDTDNSGRDIYVSFEYPDDEIELRKIEEVLSESYKDSIKLSEISIDEVIMADYMLDLIEKNNSII